MKVALWDPVGTQQTFSHRVHSALFAVKSLVVCRGDFGYHSMLDNDVRYIETSHRFNF